MIAKYGTLFYALLALILLVSKVALHDANLMVSALLWTGVFALLLHIPGVRPLAVCIAGSGAFVLGMIITSMVAGDWEVTHRIASTCVLTPWGDLHSHHGLKGALVVAIHLAVFLAIRRASEEARPGVIRLCGRRIGRAATWISIAAVLMAPFVVREDSVAGYAVNVQRHTLLWSVSLSARGSMREGTSDGSGSRLSSQPVSVWLSRSSSPPGSSSPERWSTAGRRRPPSFCGTPKAIQPVIRR